MEKLIYIAKIIGAIATLSGFIGGIFVTIRKFIHLMDKVETIIENNNQNHENIEKLEEQIENQKKAEEKSHDLLLSIARRQLLESFNKILTEKEMTQETFVVISALYNSYESNGGNSVICDMWKLITQNVEVTGKKES